MDDGNEDNDGACRNCLAALAVMGSSTDLAQRTAWIRCAMMNLEARLVPEHLPDGSLRRRDPSDDLQQR